ncbi:MAG: phosphate:Na+ symporter [Porticoccus sp.]|jgi:phosphate:Na+ symporter
MLIINLLIGLGIFLFGMMQLERSIETLSGRWVKVWLERSTNNSFSSIFAGTTITAIVQSSSMVSLVVLAFASAGIMPLFNAIGVLLGANLGTTFTGWVVATLGFKLNLTAAALPAIGVGSLIQVFGDKQAKLKAGGAMLFGLGLLLFGLSLMKDAVGNLPQQIELETLKDIGPFSFLLMGIVLTAIIQSSSASMMIALTALHSGIIDLPAAAALVIGADLGTTSTTILGSLNGSAIKRQLALAHLLFNVFVDMLAFLLLLPALPWLLQWFDMSDPLYSLVLFHSTFNLFGLCIFVPILHPYAKWIGQRFVSDKPSSALIDVPTEVPEVAIKACQQHTNALLFTAVNLNLRNLKLNIPPQSPSVTGQELFNANHEHSQSFERRYETLKQREGELLHYASQLQQQPLNNNQSNTINTLLSCTRYAVYSVKTLKDIRANLMELRHALEPTLQDFSLEYQADLRPFYEQLLTLLTQPHDENYLKEQLLLLNRQNEQLNQQLDSKIRNHGGLNNIESEQLSTLLNINREIWHSGSNLIQALTCWYGL